MVVALYLTQPENQDKVPSANYKTRMSLVVIQVNLDMTDSMGPGKLVRHMQNPSYTYDKYLICMGLGPSILSVIDESPSYSGPSYPSSPVYEQRMGNKKMHKDYNRFY